MDKAQENRKALLNVRKAFRTLAAYQQRMVSVADYIKKRSGLPSPGFFGATRFASRIRRCQLNEDYDAKLKIFPTMWAWDYLYGYFFEYYLGKHELDTSINKKEVSLSILQVSDDGFMRSNKDGKRRNIISTFEEPDLSSSWIIICVGFDDGWYYIPERVTPQQYHDSPWQDCAITTVEQLIRSDSDTYINRTGVNGQDCFFMAKRFTMEKFFDSRDIDGCLRVFSHQLKAETGISLFEF